ncbi:MAG TPA: Hsp20/alpha crystallin family protein [Candidatus Kryptonia bacterium]|nr:Hsp20/alpha crystallin family protein [Candidatus Kryptonia bacterium]
MTAQELSVRNKQEVTREEPTRPGRTYMPDVDIYETGDRLWLWADMPGVDEQSVQVNLVNGVLTLSGQVSLKDYENLAPVYTEYNVGNYVRRFTLSDTIDPNRITARMTNGVLELELPKAERAKPRKIDVAVS